MMIPQDFSSQTELEITLTDMASGVTRTLSTPLTGSWEPGKVYTYRLSTTQIVKEVTITASAPEWDYKGNVVNGQPRLQINSTYLWKTGNTYLTSAAPQPWTAQWVDTLGNQGPAPAWIGKAPSSGSGGSQTFSVTATAQTTQNNGNIHDDILKKATPVTDYDLSTKGGTAARTTANCYIVNAPGTYLIPLVYGNAIENGNTNSKAYSGLTGTPSSLFNHLGNAVTNPWIAQKSGCTPSSASIVWQDVKGLIKVNSSLASLNGGSAIKFAINPTDIKQGNAIIAVKNSSGTILWSWHIWVTDYAPGLIANNSLDSSDKTVSTYTWMPLDLGWCYGDAIYYPSRKAIIRLQTPDGFYKDISLDSNYGQEKINGRAPYWQGGRKDPLMPGSGNSTDYPCYDGNGNSVKFKYESFVSNNAKESVSYSIQHPDIYNNRRDLMLQGYKRTSNTFNNLWGAKNTTYNSDATSMNAPEKATKTIYDPSPAGYVIPSYKQIYNSFYTTFTDDANTMSYVCTLGSARMWFPKLGKRIPDNSTTSKRGTLRNIIYRS